MSTTVFRYSRPDESFEGGSASGSVDTDFLAASLVNGAPGDPAKKTGGLSLTATALTTAPVGVVAACNCNAAAASTVSIGGDVTASITVPPLPASGVPLNGYALVTEVPSAASITVATSGTVMGEFWAGKVRTLERGLMVDATLTPPGTFEWEGEFGSIPPNFNGVESRKLSGTAIVSETGLADIHAWFASTKRGTRPSLIIPFDGVNDAWLVTFTYTVTITWKHPTVAAGSIYKVAFEFTELPRTTW